MVTGLSYLAVLKQHPSIEDRACSSSFLLFGDRAYSNSTQVLGTERAQIAPKFWGQHFQNTVEVKHIPSRFVVCPLPESANIRNNIGYFVRLDTLWSSDYVSSSQGSLYHKG